MGQLTKSGAFKSRDSGVLPYGIFGATSLEQPADRLTRHPSVSPTPAQLLPPRYVDLTNYFFKYEDQVCIDCHSHHSCRFSLQRPMWEFLKVRVPVMDPNTTALVIRTPTKRSLNLQKQPEISYGEKNNYGFGA